MRRGDAAERSGAGAALAYALALAGFLELASRAALAIPALFERIAAEDDASYRLRWIASRIDFFTSSS